MVTAPHLTLRLHLRFSLAAVRRTSKKTREVGEKNKHAFGSKRRDFPPQASRHHTHTDVTDAHLNNKRSSGAHVCACTCLRDESQKHRKDGNTHAEDTQTLNTWQIYSVSLVHWQAVQLARGCRLNSDSWCKNRIWNISKPSLLVSIIQTKLEMWRETLKISRFKFTAITLAHLRERLLKSHLHLFQYLL